MRRYPQENRTYRNKELEQIACGHPVCGRCTHAQGIVAHEREQQLGPSDEVPTDTREMQEAGSIEHCELVSMDVLQPCQAHRRRRLLVARH